MVEACSVAAETAAELTTVASKAEITMACCLIFQKFISYLMNNNLKIYSYKPFPLIGSYD